MPVQYSQSYSSNSLVSLVDHPSLVDHLSLATSSGKRLYEMQPGRPGLLPFISRSYTFTSAS